MTTWLVAAALSAPAIAAPTSDSIFAAALNAGHAEIAPARVRFTSWSEEDTLLDLLRDRDPEVRRQAVRSLKPYIPMRSSTRDRVLDVYRNTVEVMAVRREAAKSLSTVSGYREVYEPLTDYARRGTDSALRAISWKSLYWIASQRSDVRDQLLDAARREVVTEVRLAAIWALFVASGDNRVQDVLKEIAQRDVNQDARVEALKSLWGAMGHNDVRDLAYDLARNTTTPGSVRKAAILLHSNRTNSNQKDLLEDIARRDSDPVMRQAAILALGNAQSEEVQTYFHLVRRGHNGVVVSDPLDAE